MSDKKKFNIWIHVKGIIVVTFIGTAISLLFSGFNNFTLNYLFINMLYSLMIGATLWIGNYSIDPFLEIIFRNITYNIFNG